MTGPTAAAPPGVDEVRRIVGIANPVIRNLEITHCYWRLANAVAASTGEGANWCTFATWASRQAGGTIRGEDLVARLAARHPRRRALLHPVRTLWRLLLRRGLLDPQSRVGRLTAQLHTPFDAFERASDAVARGNLKVFEEIGLEFARYLDTVPPDAPADSAELQAFLDGLRPGDPPDGQRYLRQAFERYDRGRVAASPKERVELAVLANLEIGFHEQTRLQPEIREAVDAATARLQDLGFVASRLQRAASEAAREAITECLLVLSLPGRVLALGSHLDDALPDDLREVGDADLAALLALYEPVAPAPDDCGARDWSDLAQRMHYIAHLFRVFHASPDLFQPPFTPEQVESIARGRVPEGDL